MNRVIFDRYRNKMDDRGDISHHIVFLLAEKKCCFFLNYLFHGI